MGVSMNVLRARVRFDRTSTSFNRAFFDFIHASLDFVHVRMDFLRVPFDFIDRASTSIRGPPDHMDALPGRERGVIHAVARPIEGMAQVVGSKVSAMDLDRGRTHWHHPPWQARLPRVKFPATVKRLIDGTWQVRSVGTAAGDVTVVGASREEALEKARLEIRYRIEWCPCSAVSDEFVELVAVEAPASRWPGSVF